MNLRAKPSRAYHGRTTFRMVAMDFDISAKLPHRVDKALQPALKI
jgi:hypothetical protein